MESDTVGITRWYSLSRTEGKNKVAVVSMEVVQYGDRAWIMGLIENKTNAFQKSVPSFLEELTRRGVVLVQGYAAWHFVLSFKRAASSAGYTSEITHKTHITHDDRWVYGIDIWLKKKDEVWKPCLLGSV